MSHESSCLAQTSSSAAAGFFVGTLAGGLGAMWDRVPAVMQNRSLPALAKTAGVMGSTGGVLAAIGAAYSGVTCASAGIRGEDDIWNGVVGALAAGQIFGVRGRSVGLGLGCGAILAVVSATLDARGLGGDLRGSNGLFEDNSTPPRVYHPYKSSAARVNGE